MEVNKWARTKQKKAEAFALHLAKVFVPNEAAPGSNEADIDNVLQQPFQLDIPLNATTPAEVIRTIRQLESKKAPGFDLVDKKVLSELPRKAIVYLTALFNCIIRVAYYPALWKVSQITMIHKSGKPPHQVHPTDQSAYYPSYLKFLRRYY